VSTRWLLPPLPLPAALLAPATERVRRSVGRKAAGAHEAVAGEAEATRIAVGARSGAPRKLPRPEL